MATRAQRVDGRRSGVLLTLLLVLLGGALVQSLSTRDTAGRAGPAPDPRREPAAHASVARQAEVKRRFDEAVVMLHAKRFDHAATALHRVLELEPRLPEAHANMGYAMLGLGKPKAARDFFDSATELNPRQANAYHGLALAYEALGDLRLALSAMRSYVHLAGPDENPRHLARARAALWEWEAQLSAGAPVAAASTPAR